MTESYKCPHCDYGIKALDEFCPNCKFPLKGTELEKSKFIGQHILKKDKIKIAIAAKKVSKFVLIGLGTWYSIGPLLSLINGIFNFSGILSLTIGLIFIVFGFFTNKFPIISLVVPMSIMLILIIATIILTYATDLVLLKEFNDFFFYLMNELTKLAFLGTALYMVINERKIKKEHTNLQKINAL